MFSAIDAPKSKSITIAFMSLKSMILGIILTTSYSSLSSSQNCEDLQSDVPVIQLFFVVGCVLDTLALCYFYFTSTFSRLEYYVFYAFHIIIAIFLTANILSQISSEFYCGMSSEFLGAVMFLSLVFLVSSVIVMWANIYFGLKYAHLGSNIVWTFMWFTAKSSCGQIIISIIASIHGILSIIGLISFIVMHMLKKTTCTAKGWKYLMIASIFAMLICYLLCILEFLVPKQCTDALFFTLSYKYFGLFELISPILCLIFLRLEMGDPRDLILKKKEELFTKWRENPIIQDENH